MLEHIEGLKSVINCLLLIQFTLLSRWEIHFDINIKGTRCLRSDELVYKMPFVTVCYKMHMAGKMFLK